MIQHEIGRSAEGMKSGNAVVARGVRVTDEAKAIIDEISKASDRGLERVNEIVVAAQQQATSQEEVSAGMVQITDVTRDFEDGSKEIQMMARNLASLSEEMRSTASWFQYTNSASSAVLTGKAESEGQLYLGGNDDGVNPTV